MPTTPRGLLYPNSSEHTRLWEHLQGLADSIEDALDVLHPAGAWTAYVPTWTAVTTNPVLGTGTIVGKYRKIERTVHFLIHLTTGGTTTYGNGVWKFGLPFAPAAVAQVVGAGAMVDASAGLTIPIGFYGDAGSEVRASRYDGTFLAHNGPLVWATGDQVKLAGTYESAA